jgi:hypothetical protein
MGVGNVGANTTVDLRFAQNSISGITVPAGYRFHALYLLFIANAAITAGTATGKVHAGGTELLHGPVVTLSSTAQSGYALSRLGSQTIAAGTVAGISVTTTADYDPTTVDYDAYLIGVLTPV